ncbi:hypothetical protein [Xylanibacter muris]|uniref:Aromatic hydrocarbon degradation protein n=1 Tax=Xylanibacter muris TaxID=2736290 RepID=A0ABX2ALZ4_9BACT|nr:hypothetical protein [Xylanibacter muris]NPD91272.1 hypothetical protein [Xylanibacter muris]
MKKIIFSSIFCSVCVLAANAQSGTNSPYSQYGLGVLSDQSQGFNRGMNGLGIGLRSGNNVNVLNPASYSSVDSMTMLIDAGLSGQITNFKENGMKINANNADFEYMTASFRLKKNFGIGLGVIPFTNIGYNYSVSKRVENSSLVSTEAFSGNGGLHQAFIGLGYKFGDRLSLGFNASYLWGCYEKTIQNSSSESYASTVQKTYSATVNSYKLDFGVQWEQPLSEKDMLTLGAIYGLGHSLGANPQVTTSNRNSMTGVSTENTSSVDDGLSIPHSFGAGAAFRHGNKYMVGLDYSLQTWGKLDYPEMNNATGNYEMKSGLLCDRHKVTFGGEWIPDSEGRNFFGRMHYRAGVSYATPYYKVNSMDGPKEISVSAGFGIPIINARQRRSILNVSAQWVHSSAKKLITENTFRINIGLTFNERWFVKWKVD